MQKMLTDQMVLFIDTLMLFIDSGLDALSENERQECIFLFIQNAGFLDLTKCERSGDIWQMNDKAYETFKCRPRDDQKYLSIALDCISRHRGCGANDRWHYFAKTLGLVFLLEDESVFRWLATTIKTINYSVDHFHLEGVSVELQNETIMFLLDTIANIDAERCAEHYLSLNRFRSRLH